MKFGTNSAKRGSVAAVMLASLFASHANAQQGNPAGFYFGVFGGQSAYDVNAEDIDAAFILAFEANGFDVLDSNSSMDDKDTAFGALAGYRFSPYIALEAAYVDLGSAQYAGSLLVEDGFDASEIDGNASISSSGPSLSVVGTLPVGDSFELYGKAGVFFADTQVRFNVQGFGESRSASGENAAFGIGAAWNITPSWTTRLEFQRYSDVGDDEETGQGDIDLLSLGIVYRL